MSAATDFLLKHSYAEISNSETFDWNKFLSRQRHTKAEWAHAELLAESWPTCAVGNQCAALPRYEFGQPKDENLRHLGKVFNAYIKQRNILSARGVMQRIEEHSAELLGRLGLTT